MALRKIVYLSVFAPLVSVGLAACSEGEPLSQQAFVDAVEQELEAAQPAVQISNKDETGFDYRMPSGRRGRLEVSDEYSYYVQNPDSLDDLMSRILSLVPDRDPLEKIGASSSRLHKSLLPMLKHPSFLAEAETRASGQPLLYGEHTSGLLVFFVVDHPTSISYLTAGSLRGLKLTREELSQTAVWNLSHRTGEDRFVVEQTPHGPIAVGQTMDGYDAARLICPTLLTTLSGPLDTDELAVAVPRRDLLLAVDAHNEPLRQQIQARAAREHAAGPFPVSDRLYRVSRQGAQPFSR